MAETEADTTPTPSRTQEARPGAEDAARVDEGAVARGVVFTETEPKGGGGLDAGPLEGANN